MQIKTCLPLALGAIASAQSLTDVLGNNTAELSTLISLLGDQPAIVSALGAASDITILAPNNHAFEAFLATPEGAAAGGDLSTVAALLTYHVINGTFYASNFTSKPAFAHTLLANTTFANVTGGQVVEAMSNGSDVTIISGTLAESKVVTANLNFTGGTIHVIDSVLSIPSAVGATAQAAGLTSLVGALTKADLVSAVEGLTDVTIFAPNNAAFDAISSATANISVADLSSILTYHVVNGTVGYSSGLVSGSITTLNGGNVAIQVADDGSVTVNGAKVITPNVLVANGVVHVIDSVLSPAQASSVPSPTTAGMPAPTSSGAAVSSLAAGGAGRSWSNGVIGMGALFGGAAAFMNL